MSTVLPADTPAAAPAQRAGALPVYRAERLSALEPFLARCDRLLHANSLPFHQRAWLAAWYETLGQAEGRQPLLLAVRGAASQDLLLLPLVQRATPWGRVAEFADADVVDYGLPLMAEDWTQGAEPAAAARALWAALRGALRGCDLLRLDKQLAAALDGAPGGMPPANPLVLALPMQPSDYFGNHFSAPAGWEAWRRSLDKTVRKEIERCWRVFERSPGARFEQVATVPEALALFEVLEAQQRERAAQLGQPYRLDEPAYRAFYRRLIETGLPTGQVVLTVLRDGEAVVSALFSVASACRMVGLRQSIGGAAWRHVSPGRLLDEGTARHLHARGLTQFDFGIGDYHHKAVLKMQAIPLHTCCVALSWRGQPAAWAWAARRWLKQQAWLRQLWLDRLKPLALRLRGPTR